MATGSGKTLIMHLNYRQFMHYNARPLDNILLITPNEGMTEQHLAELAASEIPARRFDLKESGLGFAAKNTVRVIEITKLVEEKRGGGVTVPVEAFEGNNLIFVDEGHKGSGGEVWRKYRDALGQTGRELPIPDESLELVDWERAYLDLLEYKQRKGMNSARSRHARACFRPTKSSAP